MADTQARPGETGQPSEPTGAKENVTMRMADDTAPEASGSDEATVPSFRLKEEADKRRGAEARLAQTQAQLQQAQSILINNSRQSQQVEREDPEDAQVALFGRPEDGAREAHSAVKQVAQAEAQAAADALYRRVMYDVDNKVGSVTATMTTASHLSDMKSKGLLDDRAEIEMGVRMSAKIREHQGWALAENQQNLRDTVCMEMLRAGVIRPSTVAPGTPSDRGTSPLQPSGGGGQATRSQENVDNELRQIQAANPKTLGNLTIERLRELDPGSAAPAVVPNQPVQYVHTR